MRITRRTLFVGAGTGAVAMLLASCTGEPDPAPTTASPTPTGTPTPLPSNGVPAPAAWRRSAWAVDPSACGAVSYLPAGATPQHREALAQPIDDRLFFAGEALDSERPGTIVGATASGERAAEALVEVAAEGERIAVVGLGAAGAAAAQRLAGAGFDVTAIEARDRVGGRIHSVSDEDWGVPVQLGAWTLGEEDDAVLGRLRLLGIPELDLDTAVGWSEDGEQPPVEGDEIASALSLAGDAAADQPLADALAEAGADPADPALAAALAWYAARTGADPDAVSSWFAPDFPAAPRTGAAGDLAALVESALDDVSTTLSTPVVRIAHDERGVSLRLGTGEALSYDRVVVTVPLGVLQQQGIEFSPALPFSHRGAIAALGVGHIETVWLRFDEPFWATDATVWQVIGGEGTIRTWFNLAPATGEAVLVGVVGGADAAAFAEMADDEAEAEAVRSLSAFAPPAASSDGAGRTARP